jgi:hypothetical protein
MGGVEVYLHLLGLGTRWKWVISFTPRSLYPLDKWLGEAVIRPGRCGEEKNLALPGIEHRASSPWPVAIQTAQAIVFFKMNWSAPLPNTPRAKVVLLNYAQGQKCSSELGNRFSKAPKLIVVVLMTTDFEEMMNRFINVTTPNSIGSFPNNILTACSICHESIQANQWTDTHTFPNSLNTP